MRLWKLEAGQRVRVVIGDVAARLSAENPGLRIFILIAEVSIRTGPTHLWATNVIKSAAEAGRTNKATGKTRGRGK